MDNANAIHTANSLSNTAANAAANLTHKAADAVTEKAQALQDRVDGMLTAAPAAIDKAINDAASFAHSGLERARQASTQAREQIERAGDRTVGYIKDEPVKSILIATAVGALGATLIGWAARSRSAR